MRLNWVRRGFLFGSLSQHGGSELCSWARAKVADGAKSRSVAQMAGLGAQGSRAANISRDLSRWAWRHLEMPVPASFSAAQPQPQGGKHEVKRAQSQFEHRASDVPARMCLRPSTGLR